MAGKKKAKRIRVSKKTVRLAERALSLMDTQELRIRQWRAVLSAKTNKKRRAALQEWLDSGLPTEMFNLVPLAELEPFERRFAWVGRLGLAYRLLAETCLLLEDGELFDETFARMTM